MTVESSSKATEKITQLIINSAYNKPNEYWEAEESTKSFSLQKGRRPSGYFETPSTRSSMYDRGEFKLLDLVNDIRDRVERWQKEGRPGLTGISRQLLQHWTDSDEDKRFFYCQLEAIETLMFLTESSKGRYRVGLDIPNDGGQFTRWCSKMATGSGKTVVMAMIVAWNIINKVTYPKDIRFGKNILIVAPNLTVKSRLSVLKLRNDDNNYYNGINGFDIVPIDLRSRLYQGKLKIINWHMLARKEHKQARVDKRGKESDEKLTRRILDDMANVKNILVINDEAHHAWRLNPQQSMTYKKNRDVDKQATIWIQGLDILHKQRSILRCHDLTATPFVPKGNQNKQEWLFEWIVSDFGLNDAIESGLIKTPRLVHKTDSEEIDIQTGKSKLYHIYADEEVKQNLNKKSKKSLQEALPDLVVDAYLALATDWQKNKR